MIKTLFSIAMMLAVYIAAADCQAKPTLYPGAVPATSGEQTGFMSSEQYSISVYYTRDGFDKVRGYYVNENGAPRNEREDADRGRSAFFSYYRRMPDDIGVEITERLGRSRVPSAIFSRLEGMVVQGIITRQMVEEIIDRFGYLENCYFTSERDENGRLVSQDDIIFSKYDQKLGTGTTKPESAGEIMDRAQQLMAQGRMQEGMELLKKFQEEQLAGIELVTSPRAAEMWVECLEELAAAAYDIRIQIVL